MTDKLHHFCCTILAYGAWSKVRYREHRVYIWPKSRPKGREIKSILDYNLVLYVAILFWCPVELNTHNKLPKVTQMHGKYNSAVSSEPKKVLVLWHKCSLDS